MFVIPSNPSIKSLHWIMIAKYSPSVYCLILNETLFPGSVIELTWHKIAESFDKQEGQSPTVYASISIQ